MRVDTKNWSWLKKTGIVFAIFSSLGFSFYGLAEAAISFKFDQRYLRSSEAEIKKNLDPRYITTIEYAAIKKQERIVNLKEKVFMLEFKDEQGKITALEKALLERYKRELFSLTNSRRG